MTSSSSIQSVVLKAVNAEDISYLKKVENDPDVRPYIRPWERQEHEAALSDKQIIYFLAQDKRTEKRVGLVILRRNEERPKTIEFIRLAIENRSSGFGVATINAVLQFAKEEGLNSIWLEVFPNNKSARTVYGKVGFKEVSRSKTDRGFGGKPGEVIRMEHILSEN